MWEWFLPNGDSKESYKHCVDFGTYSAITAQHCPILDLIQLWIFCDILRNQRNVDYLLYAICIQPLIRLTLKKGREHCEEWIELELPSNNHCGRETTKRLWGTNEGYNARCVYLVSVHKIPLELVVNIN